MREHRAWLLCLSFLFGAPWANAACPDLLTQPRSVSAATQPFHTSPADFNHDGNLDLAVLGHAAVALQLGRGDGTFVSPGTLYPTTAGNYNMTTGDLNLDGHADVVAMSLVGSTITVVLGKGDGTGTAATYPTVLSPFSIAISDVTSDGKPDLLIGSLSGGLTVHAGDGHGTFAAPKAALGTLNTPTAISIADLNADEKSDVVVILGESNVVGTFFGRGDGTFSTGPSAPIPLTGSSRSLATGDFNRDGILDAAIGSGTFEGIAVYLGSGGGAFHPPKQYDSIRGGWVMHTADFTNDGKLDLVLSSQYVPGIQLFTGAGDGTFARAIDYANVYTSLGVSVGDFTGDRKNDIAFPDDLSHTIGILKNVGDCGSMKRRSARH